MPSMGSPDFPITDKAQSPSGDEVRKMLPVLSKVSISNKRGVEYESSTL